MSILIIKFISILSLHHLVDKYHVVAGTHTAPVEHFKRIIGTGLIHHGFGEFQIFLFRPKVHFLDGFASNRPRPSCRVVGEIIKVYRMVEYRRQLCVDCPQIICGIGLSFLVPVCHQLISA